MAKNVPESVSVVQLSIAQYSVYGYNDIQSTMTGCDAGGLGFHMLFWENSLSKPAGGRGSFRIAIFHDNFYNDKEKRNEQVNNRYFIKHAQWKIMQK